MNFTEPDDGSIRRSRHRPTVDLPEPDSPTRPSVCPDSTSNDTPETACTVERTARTPSRDLTVKFLTRSVTSRTGPPIVATDAAPPAARALRSLTAPLPARGRPPGRRPTRGHRRGGAPAGRRRTP